MINYEVIDYVQSFKKNNKELYELMNEVTHDYDIDDNQHFHHSEGSIWSHTMCVFTNLINDYMSNSNNTLSLELVLATLLHDIGKCYTLDIKDDNKKLFSNHPNYGSLLAYDVLKNMKIDPNTVNYRTIIELINLHMYFSFNFGSFENNRYVISPKGLKLLYNSFGFNTYTITLYENLLALLKYDGFGRITSLDKYNEVIIRYKILSSYIDELYKKIGNRSNIRDNKKELIMLIGVPGSGKSTYRDKLINSNKEYRISSFDDLINMEAEDSNVTYNKIFSNKELLRDIESEYTSIYKEYIYNFENIIVDATNLTYNSRGRKLSIVDRNRYKTKAIVFIRSIEDIKKVNEIRREEGYKYINDDDLFNMCRRFEVPLYSEFDSIEYRFL